MLGWDEGVDGIPVSVRNVSSGILSPRVQGTLSPPVPLSSSPPSPEIAATAPSGMSCSALGRGGAGAGPWVLSPGC